LTIISDIVCDEVAGTFFEAPALIKFIARSAEVAELGGTAERAAELARLADS